MATKRRLAEQIIRIKAGGDYASDFFIKEEEVYLLIGQAANFLLKLEIYNKAKEGDKTPITQFIATFEDVPVKRNNKRNHDYLDLPANYISLPHNKGVYHISPMGCEEEEVIIVPPNARFLDAGSVNENYEGNVAAYIEGRKAIFMGDVSDSFETCLVKLIIADPGELDPDEEFPCTPEMEIQIIEAVLIKLPDAEEEESIQSKESE